GGRRRRRQAAPDLFQGRGHRRRRRVGHLEGGGSRLLLVLPRLPPRPHLAERGTQGVSDQVPAATGSCRICEAPEGPAYPGPFSSVFQSTPGCFPAPEDPAASTCWTDIDGRSCRLSVECISRRRGS